MAKTTQQHVRKVLAASLKAAKAPKAKPKAEPVVTMTKKPRKPKAEPVRDPDGHVVSGAPKKTRKKRVLADLSVTPPTGVPENTMTIAAAPLHLTENAKLVAVDPTFISGMKQDVVQILEYVESPPLDIVQQIMVSPYYHDMLKHLGEVVLAQIKRSKVATAAVKELTEEDVV